MQLARERTMASVLAVLKFVLIVFLIKKIRAQQNPCPNIIEYKYSDKGTAQNNDHLYGMITIAPRTDNNNIVNLTVSMEVFNSVKEFERGSITYLGTAKDVTDNLPLIYKINFAKWTFPFLPQILSIKLNGGQICSGTSIREKDHASILNRLTIARVTLLIDLMVTTDQGGLIKTITSRVGETENTDSFPYEQDIHVRQFTPSNESISSTPSSTDCGISSSRTEDAPWMAAVLRRAKQNLEFLCGANLISKLHLLTAARCVTQLDKSELVVIFGTRLLPEKLDDRSHQRSVSRIVSSKDEEIALIVLSEPVEFTSKVQPICVWMGQNTLIYSIIAKEGTVDGWESLKDDGAPNRLRQETLQVISNENCWKSDPTSNRKFCTGYGDGTEPCKMGIGSGFYLKVNDRWNVRGIAYQSASITSFCVFFDVAKHIDWLLPYLS